MANARAKIERSRNRERITTLLLALFPLLVATGFFAPGFVRLRAIAEEADPGARAVVVDRIGPHGHRPLLVPRDFSAGFVSELLDLNQLFASNGTHLDPTGPQLARVSAFDRSFGDSITHDGAARVIMDIVFKDALMDVAAIKQTMVAANDSDRTNLGLCGMLHATNCVRDDGLTSVGVVIGVPIPEPGTGSLLTLGLLGLGIAGRRS